MKILLDTHVFLWASGPTERLAEETLDLLANPDTEKFLSAASVWEIALKYGKGVLPLPDHPRRFIAQTIAASDISQIPIATRDVVEVADLPHHHGDAVDRILIAQARLHGMYLLTDDKVFEQYNVDLISA